MHLYGRIHLKSSVYFKVMNHKMVQADTSGEKTPAFNIVDCASNILVIITPEIGEGGPVFDSYFSKKMARPLTGTVLEFISAI